MIMLLIQGQKYPSFVRQSISFSSTDTLQSLQKSM